MYDSITDEQLRQEISQGMDMSDFSHNASFKLIMGLLRYEALEALDMLKDADANNSDEIYSLQNVIWRYDALVNRIKEVISIGHEAEEEFKALDELSTITP